MIFQDNVIKEYLKNVYFITGTPCGGKTTISRELAKRHNLLVYDIDEQFEKHQKMSNPKSQPSMNKNFKDADEFFGRTVEEYKQWLISNTREQLDYVLMDLIRLSQDRIVLCDCHLTLEQAEQITEVSRVAFLIREPSNLVEEYCNRPDHQGFANFINSASDVAKAKKTCSATLQSLNEKAYKDIKASKYFWLERTPESTVEETLAKVERHFGLVKDSASLKTLQGRTFTQEACDLDGLPERMSDKKELEPSVVEIRKVDKDTGLAEQLLHFVENFSWEEVKEHLSENLRNWGFNEWETPFVAIVNGKIVGMASIMKTDYYPLSELYPWVSSIFVTEEYRGQRISGKLIDFANAYAASIGFDRTYIPSEHVGLYEKYGYRYLKDIVNYGGGTDRLYVKEL